MPGANAISGITITGAILASGNTGDSPTVAVFGSSAAVFETINITGGYCAMGRMPKMFGNKKNRNFIFEQI
jgi:NAD(P) transhydrogenase subunit alpha